MINRIFLVIMLVLSFFVQYFEGSPDPYTRPIFVYQELNTLTDPFQSNTTPLGITAAPPETRTTPPVVTASPYETDASPSEVTTTPASVTVSPPGITATPPEPSITTPSAFAIPNVSLRGPLVLELPAFDRESTDALVFIRDINSIVKKAVKKSALKGIYGLFIMDLKNGFYYGYNENLTVIDPKDKVPEGYFNSASVVKLYQGYLFCDMLRNGELDENKTYVDKATGRKFKLLPMLKSMISYSDNNYSNACLRIVDNKKSNEVLARLGIKNSRLYGEMSGAIGYSRENNIRRYGTDKRCARLTPQDTGLILYNIYINRETDAYMKVLNEALLGNVYNTRIPIGVKRVSAKYLVAHKTGTNSAIGVYNDAGIVYTPNPFILVAFTQGTTSSGGHSLIRSLAEQLTHYFMDKS